MKFVTATAVFLMVMAPAVYSRESDNSQPSVTPASPSTTAMSNDTDSDSSAAHPSEEGFDWLSNYEREALDNQRHLRSGSNLATAAAVALMIVIGLGCLGFLGLTIRNQRKTCQRFQLEAQETLQMSKEAQQGSQESLRLAKESLQLHGEMRDLLKEIATSTGRG